jgi:hypothetical protein
MKHCFLAARGDQLVAGMKLLTWFVAGVALLGVVHATPPQQQAFGPILFGDSQDLATKHLTEIVVDHNRAHQPETAADILRDLVYKGTKFTGRLANKYKKVAIGVLIPGPYPITSIDVGTSVLPMASFKSEGKEDWEVLQDIGNAKFGTPIQTSAFPVELTENGEFVTDTWQRGDVAVRLVIHRWSASGYTVFLRAALQPR